MNGSIYKWIILCHVACFPIPPPFTLPHFFSPNFMRLWYYEQSQEFVKEYCFLPICYVAVMRGNEMTLKVQYKNPQNCWEIVWVEFSCLVSTLLHGKLQMTDCKLELKPKILLFFFFFYVVCFVLFLQMNVSHPV